MNRRSFLVTATAAGLVGCTASSSSAEATRAADLPQVEAYLIDAQTPFSETGKPYLTALRGSEHAQAPDIEWMTLPDYGRDEGTIVRGASIAVSDNRTTLQAFFDRLPPAWQLPNTHGIRLGRDRWPEGSGPPRWGAHVVALPALLTTADILGVDAQEDSLSLLLNREGATRLEDGTKNAVGQRLAFAVDNEVMTDPIINEPIEGGRIELTFADGTPDDYRAFADRFSG